METQLAWLRTVVLVLDLGGTFVFALSGAALGIKRKLDLFGVLVLSVVAATAGGMMRDVLLGAAPPAAILDYRYLVVCIIAGLALFFLYPFRGQAQIRDRLRTPVLVFDAAGLALFAVAGAAQTAASYLPYPHG